jgi:energy-coupling factor transporter ATP-binding protein EcfA2
MITNITLDNFKCFPSVNIDPKLITVLIGPNGTGKTAILQALPLLKQSEDPGTRLDLQGPLLDLPSEDFMFHASSRKPEKVYVTVEGKRSLESPPAGSTVVFDIHVGCHPDGTMARPVNGSTTITPDGDVRTHQVRRSTDNRIRCTNVSEQFVRRGEGLDIFATNFNSEQRANPTSAMWDEAARAPTATFRDLRIVPATRSFNRNQYPLSEYPMDDIPLTAESLPEGDAASTLQYSIFDVVKVSQYMQQITGVGFSIRVVPPQSVKLLSLTPAGPVGLVAEGSGTNALVRLLFELVRAELGATILIEDPELNLHPKAQADLASAIVEEARGYGKQVIMTTHSERIAARLLIEVAEGTLPTEELAIYSFTKDSDGIASASPIEVTDKGQTSGGLTGFFETNLEEMNRHAKALMPK